MQNVSPTTRIFIAHPFNPRTQVFVDRHIKPVLHRNNIRWRTGREKSNQPNQLVGDLKAAIGGCSALVAVVAEHNPNVFFEIGVASALDKHCLLFVSEVCDGAMLRHSYPVIKMDSTEKIDLEFDRYLRSWQQSDPNSTLNKYAHR